MIQTRESDQSLVQSTLYYRITLDVLFPFFFNNDNVLRYKKFEGKIVSIFIPISFNVCFGCSKKKRLIKTVLLNTHIICFGERYQKNIFCYALLTKGLNDRSFLSFGML